MIGRRLGRFTVTARLGRGGMGTVYLAVDETGAPAALKVLAESLSSDPTVLKRFELEQQIVGGLDHPRIVQGRSGLECAEGQYYFVMDFVPGANLARVLRALHRLSAAETVHVGLQVCDALGFAHSRGIVHRDLKPSNLLIDPRGNVRVTDFGLARVAECTRVTLSGQVLGTPEYMSPEQADGRAADGRSDLYATGIVLYEMLAGEPPFRAENPLAVLRRHCNEAPTPPSASGAIVPPRLEAAILRCLEKDPLCRFESAGDLAAELRAAGGEGAPEPGARLAEIVRTNSAEETRPYLASPAVPTAATARLGRHDLARPSAAPAWFAGIAVLLAAAGGIWAVSRDAAGRRDPATDASNRPATAAPEAPRPATLRLLDGQELNGRVRAIDGRTLTFETGDGRVRIFPLDQVEACTYR